MILSCPIKIKFTEVKQFLMCILMCPYNGGKYFNLDKSINFELRFLQLINKNTIGVKKSQAVNAIKVINLLLKRTVIIII